MNKKVLMIIILIIVVCILFVASAYFSFSVFKPNKNDNNTVIDNTTVNENKIKEENMVEGNEAEENLVTSEPEKEEKKPKNVVNSGTSVVPSSSVYESNTDMGSTEKKQQAIELVKQWWGEDSDASFRCDSVTTDGEYIIAVTSIESASVKGYFRVNLANKSVEVDY